MTAALTLSDFLLARYAEDEADVQATRTNMLYVSGDVAAEDALDRLASPDRLQADIEAKRRIVELHYEVPASDIVWSDCGVCPSRPGRGWPCDTLRFLALPYADHPDYRKEWKP